MNMMIPSTTSVLSTYTAFAASAMLVKTIVHEIQTLTIQILPEKVQEKIISHLATYFGGSDSSKLTLVIDECKGLSTNEIYHASVSYLSSRITPSVKQLLVSKDPRENTISVTADKGQKIVDTFEGIQLVWEFLSTETPQTVIDIEGFSQSSEKTVHRSVLLSFNKQHKDKVIEKYLPYVLERSKEIENEKREVKIHSLGSYSGYGDTNLNHPSTFETLAMDPVVKKELVDDLDRFVKRKDFYRRVGKPWKRGYLLYGPPGTGKSSLIAAMANYLKFNIYDMELTSLRSNSELKTYLSGTTNRSILVIEDIDCSAELQDRESGYNGTNNNQLTLSGLLNFIDGLWSSCGDERIIVFTTNYKERLDPALLRPGRMDMHIEMSFLSPSGFKILALNYLQVKEHFLFGEIEEMIKEVEVTPAEVAEELMKSEDVDAALRGLIGFLGMKKQKSCETINAVEETSEEKEEAEKDEEIAEVVEEEKGVKKRGKMQKNRKKMGRKVKGRIQ